MDDPSLTKTKIVQLLTGHDIRLVFAEPKTSSCQSCPC